jgi:dTDP-4-dehydrorhamnose reductase
MRKKIVAITAPTGMLGSMMYATLKDDYTIILLYRNKKHLQTVYDRYGYDPHQKAIHFDAKDYFIEYLQGKFSYERLAHLIGEVDAIINCAGIIKPYADRQPEVTFFINSAFPHLLSNIYGEKLIHITTDCVFDGIHNPPYTENAIHSATDFYGISKSLGEPSQRSLVLRTSIIGPEIHSFVSLISWLKKQQGEVFGYTNHLWNGITTKQFAEICRIIINARSSYPAHGLFHIFSEDITKYNMVTQLQKKYNLPITVTPKEAEPIDRRLRSLYALVTKLTIPSFAEMIAAL